MTSRLRVFCSDVASADSLSLIGRMLNEMVGAPGPQEPEPEEDCYLRAKRRMMRKNRKPWFVCEGYGRDWRIS